MIILWLVEDSSAKAVEVVGYWMTLDIQTLKYEAPNQLITLKAGKDSPTIGKKGNITAGLLEELVSGNTLAYKLYISDKSSFLV